MITIAPTKSEKVSIRHDAWHAEWGLQFPEMIVASDAVIKHWTAIEPKWERLGDRAWAYRWRPDERYVADREPQVQRDEAGNPLYPLRTGMALEAKIVAAEDAVRLSLTLTNETSATLERVMCEGGCLHALAAPFKGDDVVARSFVSCDGRMVSMAKLHRTRARHCAYQHDPAGYEQPVERRCEGMWGRSDVRIDAPAIVGMRSVDAKHAYVIGYEGSASALANTKHCCLHSRPQFGDVEPGQRVTRSGCILFGHDLPALAQRLRGLL